MARSVAFAYASLRNITAGNSKSGRKVLAGYAPISVIGALSTTENVRAALPKTTAVDKIVIASLIEQPYEFHLKNGGITILARSAVERADIKKTIIHHKGSKFKYDAVGQLDLTDASIINGAQTQKCINKYLASRQQMFSDAEIDVVEEMPLVKFEIIVSDSEEDWDELFPEITIARNTQTKVEQLSILGAKGAFDELIDVQNIDEVLKIFPAAKHGLRIRTSETDSQAGYGGKEPMIIVDPRHMLQAVAVMSPPSVLKALRIKRHMIYSRAQHLAGAFANLKALRDIKGDVALPYGVSIPKGLCLDDMHEAYDWIVENSVRCWLMYVSVSSDLSMWKPIIGTSTAKRRSSLLTESDYNPLKGNQWVRQGLVMPVLGAFGVNHRITVTELPAIIKSLSKSFLGTFSADPHTFGKSASAHDQVESAVDLIVENMPPLPKVKGVKATIVCKK